MALLSRMPERLAALGVLATLVLLLAVASSRVHSFDVFWQLHAGRYMLENAAVIRNDLFSLAHSVERWEHCWLHDILLYLVYLAGGYAGISLLKGVLVAVTAAVTVRVARLRGASWLAVFILMPAALYQTAGGWLERPQLWSFLCFALTLLAFELGALERSARLWMLPVLMLFWVNLHAGAILMLPLLLAGAAGQVFQRRKIMMKAGAGRCLMMVLLLVLGAAFLTPYGPKALETVLPMVRVDQWQDLGIERYLSNMDWRSTSFERMPEYYYAVAGALVLAFAGWRRLDLRSALLLVGLALMGASLMRHTSFFYLGSAALLPPCLTEVGRRLSVKIRVFPSLRWVAWVGAAALLLFLYRPLYKTYGFFDIGLRHWHYPVEAAEFVRKAALPGNLYNTYDWGGYLMWALYPEYLVFWDGRSSSEAIFREGLSIMKAEPGWERRLSRNGVNLVVTKACLVDTGQRYPIVDALRFSSDWALVFADESSLVFVRRSAVSSDWLRSYELPDSRALDTILSEAQLLVRYGPQRVLGWLEIARIEAQRNRHAHSRAALSQLLVRAPQAGSWPAVQRLIQQTR